MSDRLTLDDLKDVQLIGNYSWSFSIPELNFATKHLLSTVIKIIRKGDTQKLFMTHVVPAGVDELSYSGLIFEASRYQAVEAKFTTYNDQGDIRTTYSFLLKYIGCEITYDHVGNDKTLSHIVEFDVLRTILL